MDDEAPPKAGPRPFSARGGYTFGGQSLAMTMQKFLARLL